MPTLSRKRRHPRHLLAAGAALVVLSAVLAVVQRSEAGFGSVRDVGTAAMMPFVEAGKGTRNFFNNIRLAYVETGEVRAENEALRAELARLQVEKARAQSRAEEFDQSRIFSANVPDFAPRAQTAPVISAVLDGKRRQLWIGLGRDHGIEEGQTVLGPRGVVGTVRDARSGHAIVQLVTDRDSKWGGRVDRAGELGILSGMGTASTARCSAPAGRSGPAPR